MLAVQVEFVFFASKITVSFVGRHGIEPYHVVWLLSLKKSKADQLTSAAVASCVSTLGLPLAFFPSLVTPPSSFVRDLFLDRVPFCSSDSELVMMSFVEISVRGPIRDGVGGFHRKLGTPFLTQGVRQSGIRFCNESSDPPQA